MNETVEKAVNDQIQAEFASAYLYLAMAARFDAEGLPGFGQWLRVQWEEETAHAMKFYDFLLQRGGTVTLQAIEQPDVGFDTPLAAFREVLDHEQYITRRIHTLYDLAVKERDYPLQTLLHWFIDEQLEEEETARAIIDSLRLAGESGPSLLLLDREMGNRSAPEEAA